MIGGSAVWSSWNSRARESLWAPYQVEPVTSIGTLEVGKGERKWISRVCSRTSWFVELFPDLLYRALLLCRLRAGGWAGWTRREPDRRSGSKLESPDIEQGGGVFDIQRGNHTPVGGNLASWHDDVGSRWLACKDVVWCGEGERVATRSGKLSGRNDVASGERLVYLGSCNLYRAGTAADRHASETSYPTLQQNGVEENRFPTQFGPQFESRLTDHCSPLPTDQRRRAPVDTLLIRCWCRNTVLKAIIFSVAGG